MTLPDYIFDFFVKIQTGILSPIISGITYIAPFLLIIGLICSIIWVIFATRKAVAVGFVIVLLFGNVCLNTLPTAVTLMNEWFGANSTVDLSSATQAYEQGLQQSENAMNGN